MVHNSGWCFSKWCLDNSDDDQIERLFQPPFGSGKLATNKSESMNKSLKLDPDPYQIYNYSNCYRMMIELFLLLSLQMNASSTKV